MRAVSFRFSQKCGTAYQPQPAQTPYNRSRKEQTALTFRSTETHNHHPHHTPPTPSTQSRPIQQARSQVSQRGTSAVEVPISVLITLGQKGDKARNFVCLFTR
eukprot:GHVN01046203.1.p4 GENE.GHVN01046203.1~~GHVN01046203.1.p4  ORF type:complete len:103 (-),score=15.58 GHVN01046203.1:253-561(-)